MKKILYSLIAVLAFTAMSCEEAKTGENAVDPNPTVTLYEMALPDGANPDLSCKLRLAPNAQTKEMYILQELKKTKDAEIEANGEKAYIEKVIAKGKKYEVKDQDILFEELKGLFSISVVCVKGNKKSMKEYVFDGVAWVDYAEGIFASFSMSGATGLPIANCQWPATMQKADGKDLYRIKDTYAPFSGVEGKHWPFFWDGKSEKIEMKSEHTGSGLAIIPSSVVFTGLGEAIMLVNEKASYYEAAKNRLVFMAGMKIGPHDFPASPELYVIQNVL